MITLTCMIVVGAIAFRGACTLMNTLRSPLFSPVDFPFWLLKPMGQRIVLYYIAAAIPIAFLNAFLLHYNLLESVLGGIGTFLLMLVVPLFSMGDPQVQLIFFGMVNLVWLAVNIARAIA